MNQEAKNTLLAVAACLAFYLLYNQYLSKKYPQLNQPAQTETLAVNPATQSTPGPQAVPTQTIGAITNLAATPTVPAKTMIALNNDQLKFENDYLKLEFDQQFSAVKSVKLKKYRSDFKDRDSQVELLDSPLIFQGDVLASVSQNALPKLNQGFDGQRVDDTIEFSRTQGPWLIQQKITLPATGYVSKVHVTFKNTSAVAEPLVAGLQVGGAVQGEKKKAGFTLPGSPDVKPRFVATYVTTDDFYEASTFCEVEPKALNGANTAFDFIGFDSHYFLAAFVPKIPLQYSVAKSPVVPNLAEGSICRTGFLLSQNFGTVAAQASEKLEFDLYLGPKDLETITNFNQKLKTTLGLGWLDMIARPLLLSLKGIYKITKNYGLAVILLTLLIKIAFFPLARQSAISMAKMKKLNPQMTEIREKHKKDPQKMQRELMAFMGAHKINPMKGCLPILPQIPVFFALFRCLSASIELRHAPFIGWIQDLSVADPYYITPLALGGLMFVQQKLTPMTGLDKTQEKMMLFMPVIFTVMMLSLPSGMVLYMLTNTLTSIAQQQWLNKKLKING